MPSAAAASRQGHRLDLPLAVHLELEAPANPHRYEQAAVRWLSHWCLQRPGVALQELNTATLALEELRTTDASGEPLRVLRDLSRPP